MQNEESCDYLIDVHVKRHQVLGKSLNLAKKKKELIAMCRRSCPFLQCLTILCSLLALYALFNCLVLTPQPVIAQIAITAPLQSTKLIMEGSTQMSQNNDRNRMAVHLNLGGQLIGTSTENVVWENVAVGSNTTHNNATSPLKAAEGVSHTNSSNCTTPTATALSKLSVGLLHTYSTIGGKTYTITYDITGNGNRLKSTAAQTRNATLLVNINSTNNGNLTIDLPRKVIDSKTLGNKDSHYAVSESGRSNIKCVEIKSTQDARTLVIDFVKDIRQIAITGTNIFPSNDTGPIVAVGKAKLAVNESLPVILNGSGSRDPDREPITFAWTQTSGPNVMLKGGNTSMATFTAPKVSNETKMSFNLRVKDIAGLTNNATETVIVKHIARPPSTILNATGPTSPSAYVPLLSTVLIYAAIVAAFMFLPLIYDMAKTYKQKGKPGTEVTGFPDLARSLMAFGIIIILAILAFHVLVTITYNVLPTGTNTALVDIIKNLSTILGGAVSAIIGFYFGQRSIEKSGTTGGTVRVGPTVVSTVPSDGSHPVPVDSKITAIFSEPISIEASSFTLKDNKNNPVQGTTSLSQDGKTLEFKPSNKLDSSATYIATITGVKDLAGNTMSSPKTWVVNTAPA